MAENTKPQENEKLVLKGDVRVEKKTAKKKILGFLFSDKIDSVGSYLLTNIIGPSLKNLIFNLGDGALRMALFGNGGAVQSNEGSYIPGYGFQPGRKDPLAYSAVSNPTYAQPQVAAYPTRIQINDISFSSKDDVWSVLDRMGADLARYGKVKVADYYNYAGITGEQDNWALSSIGWYTLAGAQPIMRTDGRWIIDFPPVQQLR